MINDAAARHLVEVCPNPAHKRSSLIRLTEEGRAAITAVIDREREVLRSLGGELTDAEIDACVRVPLASCACSTTSTSTERVPSRAVPRRPYRPSVRAFSVPGPGGGMVPWIGRKVDIMSLNIKNPETHRLVQELASLTGESQTQP